MKSSKFAITTFVISVLVFIQALIVFIDVPETHPLASILFFLVLLIYLPEYPMGYLPQYLGFPIILPVLSIIFALISFRKKEDKKILAILSIVLILISISLFLALRFLPDFKTEPVKTAEQNLCGPEPPAICAAGMRLTCVNGEWSCKEIEEKVVFYSKEECEQKTNKSCDFQACDYIPLNKTFEETCGKDFKKSWIPKNPVLNQTPPENQKIIGKIIFSDLEGGCWNFQGDKGEYFLIDGSKSEEIKKIPDILSKKVEIQGKIEKDIAHFCPVGDGLFKLESYIIINNSATDVSDWKTYRNEEYGFEVKYPAHYEIYSKLENIIWIVSPDEYNKIISKVGTEVFPISIAIKNYRNLEEINNDEINNLDFKKKEKINIDGFTAIKFSKGIGMDRDAVYISPKDQRYTIEFRNSIDENIFNQILSTFKFIE